MERMTCLLGVKTKITLTISGATDPAGEWNSAQTGCRAPRFLPISWMCTASLPWIPSYGNKEFHWKTWCVKSRHSLQWWIWQCWFNNHLAIAATVAISCSPEEKGTRARNYSFEHFWQSDGPVISLSMLVASPHLAIVASKLKWIWN